LLIWVCSLVRRWTTSFVTDGRFFVVLECSSWISLWEKPKCFLSRHYRVWKSFIWTTSRTSSEDFMKRALLVQVYESPLSHADDSGGFPALCLGRTCCLILRVAIIEMTRLSTNFTSCRAIQSLVMFLQWDYCHNASLKFFIAGVLSHDTVLRKYKQLGSEYITSCFLHSLSISFKREPLVHISLVIFGRMNTSGYVLIVMSK
jgi:hypothetical protein